MWELSKGHYIVIYLALAILRDFSAKTIEAEEFR